MLETERQPTYESTSTPPVVETPNQELVVARQTPVETPEAVGQTPPNPSEVHAETAPAEAQPLSKQEWL